MSELAIICLGWGGDPRVAAPLAERLDMEVLYLHDWRTMPALPDLSKYNNIYLIAWSFGVWAAEQIFAKTTTEFTRAIALNGTPLPCDERLGIGLKRLKITLQGLQSRGLEEFQRRAYGEYYEELRPVLSERKLQDDIDELSALIARSLRPHTPSIKWDTAVVGSQDTIFPPANQLAYWENRAETRVKIVSLPHYPFALPELCTLIKP